MEEPVAEYKCLACGFNDYRMSKKSVGEIIPRSCPQCGGGMKVESRDELPEDLKNVGEQVGDYFRIWDFIMDSSQMKFSVESDGTKDSFSKLFDDLKEVGYRPQIEDTDGEFVLTIERIQETEEDNPLVNILLLLATIGTTFGVAGYWYIYKDAWLAALFSSSLLAILGIHELGHKLFTLRNDVDASWPYFLPVPIPLIGTMGAVIKNKSPIPTKEALVEIGSSGPFLGFIVALPVTIIGLFLSNPAGGGMFKAPFSPFAEIPTPLLYYFIGHSIFGGFPMSIDLHPLAWAGFVGLYVTWLNLLPTGQLDGGHVARSLLSRNNHLNLTRGLTFLFIFLGMFLWLGFLFIALLILFIAGGPHPGALDKATELDRRHKIIALTAFVVFILCFPIPLNMV